LVDTPGTNVLVPGTPLWEDMVLRRMDSCIDQFIATGAKIALLLEPPRVKVASEHPPTEDDFYDGKMNALLVHAAASHRGHVAVVDHEARGGRLGSVQTGWLTSARRDRRHAMRTITTSATAAIAARTSPWVNRFGQ
jgi:hypothetical protein